jgi:hypothetical protein
MITLLEAKRAGLSGLRPVVSVPVRAIFQSDSE